MFSSHPQRHLAPLAAAFVALTALSAPDAHAAFTPNLSNGTLRLSGDAAPDRLNVFLDSTSLHVDVGDDGTIESTFDRAAVTAIDVRAGDGDDTVRLSNVVGMDVSVDGGRGDDTINGSRQPGDVLNGGAGNDTFVWNPGDNSDTITGGGGNDTLRFNGANIGERFTLSSVAGGAQLTRDVANVTMKLSGVDDIRLTTLGGVDAVTVLGSADADVFTGSTDGGDTVVDGPASRLHVTSADGDIVTVDGGDGADSTVYRGTSGEDVVSVAPVGPGTAAVVDGGAAPLSNLHVEKLSVKGGDGDDQLAAQNGIAGATSLTLDGGNGADTLLGGDGDDVLIGGAGGDLVDGNRGADDASMGVGDDTFQWDPGDGSDTVSGQSGADRLAFNGANVGEDIRVGADKDHAVVTRNIAAVSMDTIGVESVAVRALGGVDTVTIDPLAGTSVRRVDTDLRGFDGASDGSVDRVVAVGDDETDHATIGSEGGVSSVTGLTVPVRAVGADPLDRLVVATQGGNDRIAASSTFAGTTPVRVEGGDGVDTTTINGTAGPDAVSVAPNGTGVAAVVGVGPQPVDNVGVEKLVVVGGEGDDTFTGSNGLAATTSLTFDGGNGADTLLGGDGDDQLWGGADADLIDGQRGADTARLGAGDDTFQWDPGDGSDVIEGEAGTDTLAFNGANIGEDVGLAADGRRLRLTRNVASVAMSTAGVDRVRLRTLGGTDHVSIGDLATTEVRSVVVDQAGFDGNPDGAADRVTVSGTARRDLVSADRSGDSVVTSGLAATTTVSGADLALDELQIDTLAGDDAVLVDPAARALLAITVDLGLDD